MKRFLSLLLCLFLLMGAVAADNVGDHNMGGGNSGGTGSGTAENTWHGGDDGVRVTVFKDGEAVTAPFDIANKDWGGKCIGFKKRHKLYYKKYSLGVIAEPDTDGYTNIVLPEKLQMQRIIGENGVSTIEYTEKYFTGYFAEWI